MIVLNDLYDYNLKIYQNTELFKFSLDSLLLAEYVQVTNKAQDILDICSGNAPIPLIIAKNNKVNITGVEIDKDTYDLACQSIKINNINNVKMLNMNAKDLKNYFPGNNFDIITCNPPFFKVSSQSLTNQKYQKAIARHELTITLEDILALIKHLLKDKGTFYLVHRPERLEEIFKAASTNNLHIKEIIFIYTNIHKEATIALFKIKKNARPGVKIKSKIINQDITTYQNIFKEEKA